jgi:hypothetical protein
VVPLFIFIAIPIAALSVGKKNINIQSNAETESTLEIYALTMLV